MNNLMIINSATHIKNAFIKKQINRLTQEEIIKITVFPRGIEFL